MSANSVPRRSEGVAGALTDSTRAVVVACMWIWERGEGRRLMLKSLSSLSSLSARAQSKKRHLCTYCFSRDYKLQPRKMHEYQNGCGEGRDGNGSYDKLVHQPSRNPSPSYRDRLLPAIREEEEEARKRRSMRTRVCVCVLNCIGGRREGEKGKEVGHSRDSSAWGACALYSRPTRNFWAG